VPPAAFRRGVINVMADPSARPRARSYSSIVSTPTVTTVADGVHVAAGPDVNWTLLVDGTDVTLIDSGYPRYVGAVIE
ncbi:hypothetical protein OLF92_11705, partial [Streptococcus pneumoniae]|nr:hypothetical protein [Streptococcus pneumoniae]